MKYTGANKINTYMKKLTTITNFSALNMPVDGKFTNCIGKDGKPVSFSTRRAVERYCEKNGVGYVEVKHIFYR